MKKFSELLGINFDLFFYPKLSKLLGLKFQSDYFLTLGIDKANKNIDVSIDELIEAYEEENA